MRLTSKSAPGEVSDINIKTTKHFRISSSRLNRIGDVFDEFSNVEKPRIAKGKFGITQKQNGHIKLLWTLKFWEVSSKIYEIGPCYLLFKV